jgi:hypothetical protein
MPAIPLWSDAHIIEAGLQTPSFMFNQLYTRRVVYKVGFYELDAFPNVQLALQHEVVVVEMELKLFICIIDTELLKTIYFEDFEAENV